jgi:murein DD-endopeptidase MepM/ murein hydrolase activator NlpD
VVDRARPTRRRSIAAPLATLLVLVTACEGVRQAAQDLFDSRTARERYEAKLRDAGLAETALARDWMMAAQRALQTAPAVTSPHREEGYLVPAEPSAIAFRVSLRRGQEVSFNLQLRGDSGTLVFLDVWRVEVDGEHGVQRVASADSGERLLRFEPRRDGDFIFRAQTELLRGGRFTIDLAVAPTLAFPVFDRRERDIGSRFGAPRDAGARSHHGIDIFAPRGTPVVAAAEGTVSRVQTTEIGGNVVWMRDRRGNSLYYAHLDRQSVNAGQDVAPGDTLGFVGNTGNARTTPPHLHFGVYRRGEGPVDPYWFVHRPVGSLPRLSADTTRFGEWVRTTTDRTIVRASPNAKSDTTAVLPRHAVLRVIAAVGGSYRVALPDGAAGYVVARTTEPAARALRRADVRGASLVLARPHAATSDQVMADIPAGQPVDVLGQYAGYALVRTQRGITGWVAQ